MKLKKGQQLKEHAAAVIAQLRKIYPDAHCELDFTNPLELLVATILSAQCTDKRVNIVTRDLFKKLRTAADYATIPQEELEVAIKSTGFFRSKSKSLRSMAHDLVNKFGGKVPASMDELTSLAGVGRKTANVVLGNAFDINAGIVVDTHVRRLAQRPAFLLAAAGARTLVLAAAGFFLVSAPMLARNASIRLITRCGVASSFGASTMRPACLARNISTSAVS